MLYVKAAHSRMTRMLSIAVAAQDLFVAIPEDAFRADISSTELRQRASSPAHM